MADSGILLSIKSQIHKVIPYAAISLFGSRAYGTPTSESDWDILVITSQPVNSAIKKNIHDSLFPLSVQIGSFINTLIVQESDWVNNPSYYSLRQTVAQGMVQL